MKDGQEGGAQEPGDYLRALREGGRMSEPLLPKNVAGDIYDILVQTCGAFEGDRDSFIYNFTERPEYGAPTEWRFQGALGFGGKFWWSGGRFYVTCYRENETQKRKKVIARANTELAALRSLKEGK